MGNGRLFDVKRLLSACRRPRRNERRFLEQSRCRHRCPSTLRMEKSMAARLLFLACGGTLATASEKHWGPGMTRMTPQLGRTSTAEPMGTPGWWRITIGSA